MNGLNPNGDWTLFVADLSTGETATVASWGLMITTAEIVPEPGSLALFVVGAGVLLGSRRRSPRRHNP
jgi:subtilisin-like proprotein convertase family protein